MTATSPHMTHWKHIACHQQSDRDCLASFIVWQAPEVLAGVKPANLINVLDQPLACGRNMAALWERDSRNQLRIAGLRSTTLSRSHSRHLTLIYRPEHLEEALADPAARAVLKSLGYAVDAPLVDRIGQLRQRLGQKEFPHEIGFFLGYPSKDVLGFMGLNHLPLTTHGSWKIYGDTESSLAILGRHSDARQALRSELTSGVTPQQLLKKQRPALSRAA